MFPFLPAIRITLARGAVRLWALCLGLGLGLVMTWIPQASAAEPGRAYTCDGDPLQAEFQPGPVDAVGIPNTLAGTLPGASVVLRWQGQQLPLPRTNDAGSPTYSDGKWSWREADADHALLRLRRPGGDQQEFRCAAIP